MPLRPETWSQQSIFRTRWAKQWKHLTAPSDWGVIHDGQRCHFISQGSIIQNGEGTFAVRKLKQEPCRQISGHTFSQLKKFDSRDAEGRQSVLLHQVKIEGGWIIGQAAASAWKVLDSSDIWESVGVVEDFNCIEGLDLPQSATGLLHGCNKDDHMFLFGMCMDACSPYTFSNSLSGTDFLYLRPYCLRASYNHFGFACAAIPSGVDPSLAVAMLGRDVALMETGNLCTPTVMSDGTVQWQKIHAHLANFVSDRGGADKPLGRLKVGSGTKSEWKGFRGCQDGFAIGPRNDGFHPFGGDCRLFRSVCIEDMFLTHTTLTLYCSIWIMYTRNLSMCMKNEENLSRRDGWPGHRLVFREEKTGGDEARCGMTFLKMYSLVEQEQVTLRHHCQGLHPGSTRQLVLSMLGIMQLDLEFCRECFALSCNTWNISNYSHSTCFSIPLRKMQHTHMLLHQPMPKTFFWGNIL